MDTDGSESETDSDRGSQSDDENCPRLVLIS